MNPAAVKRRVAGNEEWSSRDDLSGPRASPRRQRAADALTMRRTPLRPPKDPTAPCHCADPIIRSAASMWTRRLLSSVRPTPTRVRAAGSLGTRVIRILAALTEVGPRSARRGFDGDPPPTVGSQSGAA
jgi:hypothetical protein